MLRKLVKYLVLPTLFAPVFQADAQESTAQLNTTYQTTQQVPGNGIDPLVATVLKEKQLQPAPVCSDQVFIRRVYLDMTGTIPEPFAVRSFLGSKKPNKRKALINQLFEHDSFTDYWALKWCDTLRVKAEYPINLWPNAVQAYHKWVHSAISSNMPYDQFCRELLTSSGSNFRMPQVNFYRALQGKTPAALASVATLTFMGTRFDKMTQEQQKGLEPAFSRISFKGTAEWKEEIITTDFNNTEPLTITFPDGFTSDVKPGDDPRIVFTNWLVSESNPWFAKAIVNRIWFWFFGRGIIHQPDDIRADNPAVNPQLLTYLEKELIQSNYNLRHIMRLILNSRTYQQSSFSQAATTDQERYFAVYPVRRLGAEVLIDAICQITGTHEQYSSPIPEPFTFIPENERSIRLSDGSITSTFLEMFGRPSRDTGELSERSLKPSRSQNLHMINSTHIQKKIESGWRMKKMLNKNKKNPKKMIQEVYLTVLSRNPTKKEMATVTNYAKTSKAKIRTAATDLVWALINSKEFIYQH